MFAKKKKNEAFKDRGWCCFAASGTECIESVHYESVRLVRYFGVQCSTQCHKAASPSKVVGPPVGQ